MKLLPFLMENKIKVLFVVSEFYQAGTERFTYELDRALNKNLFSVEILSIIPLNASERFKDYYFEKHIELGTKVHFMHEINKISEPSLKQKIKIIFNFVKLQKTQQIYWEQLYSPASFIIKKLMKRYGSSTRYIFWIAVKKYY